MRPFVVVDEHRGKPNPVVLITADSICLEVLNGGTSNLLYTKMGDVNDVNTVAKQIGGVAVHLLYERRWRGLVSGPNLKGGMLSYDDTAPDDLEYIRAVMVKVERMYGPGRRVFVGFSAGAQYGLIALNQTPHIFTDYVSVCGTRLGTEGAIPAGVNLVQFYGAQDTRFPWDGGLSPNPLFRFLERLILEPYADRSRPGSIERLFAAANQYRIDDIRETMISGGIARRKQYNPEGGSPVVVSYLVCKPGMGGHTYHGRKRVESIPSRVGAGRPAAPDLFSVNALFVKELGLMP